MSEEPIKPAIPFNQIVEALGNKAHAFPAKYLERFSDLSPVEIKVLEGAWESIDLKRRRKLLRDLDEEIELNTLVNFDDFARFALKDADPEVKISAIRLLRECDSIRLINEFIKLASDDTSEEVRSAAAYALGHFVYLGELDEIDADRLERVEETLLRLVTEDASHHTRRRALEAIGYSSRPEAQALITNAYMAADPEWKLSSLIAMGRSADDRWESTVLTHLKDANSDLQFEAVKAAGELELRNARPLLIELLEADEYLDIDVRDAAIWAVSQIGGDLVRETLVRLMEKAENEQDESYLSEALENLDLTEGLANFELLDIDLADADLSSLEKPEEDSKKPAKPKKSSKKQE